MANNVMYESYCEFCSGESSVNWFPDFFRWRNGESSGQSGSASFHHVHVSLSWYIWYTKMKFAATKLITSKSQTKSKTIPNQELSISPKFSGKKRYSKASKIPTGPTRIFLVNSFGDLEAQTNTNVFWAQTFPRWNLYLPKKKHYQNQTYLFLWTSLLPKKIAWVQQKHPSNQVPQTDVICKLDKWSKDCPSPRFFSGGNGGWEDLGADAGVGRYGCHRGIY